MRTNLLRHVCSPSRRRRSKRARHGIAGAVAFALALATASSPAAAHGTLKAKVKAAHKRNETEHVSKEPFGKIPKGPLQIFISINQQKLHLYADGTHVADALVATGVPEHPTPMGVFSVIDKERFHRSNIYSGAPMPYMQRITWSGVAMHEGVGLGHPASHGCIRMPGEFAARLWVLHSLGARVIIARPELRPAEFADAHLFVHKERPAAPVPSAAAPAAVETVRTAQTIDDSSTSDAVTPSIRAGAGDEAGTVTAPDTNDAALKIKPADAEPVPSGEGKDAVVDGAGGAGDKADDPPATASDTTPTAPPTEGAAASEPASVDPAGPPEPTTAQAADPAAAVAGEAAAQNSAPAQPAAAADSTASQPATPQPDVAAQPAVDAVPDAVPVPFPKPAALAASTKGVPIAIFVSRKTSRLYVRQNFAPLFDAPITIAHPEQPLGTHVFTALEYSNDGASFRWNVVSLPGEEPKAARNTEKKPERDAKGGRRREPAAKSVAKPVLDPQPPQTPQQALARIEIPKDVIEQISELIVPGSSLVVSDQGLGEETGEGTDFIVVTR